MKTTHTPGPWTVKGTSIIGQGEIFGRTVASFPVSKDGMTATDEANARLIASAPALVEALQMAIRCIKDGTDPTARMITTLDACRAALRSAGVEQD